MAETIKQLVNQNFTGADMTNNNQFTLINNNSSTTVVVREVFVTGDDIAADKAKLFIDNNNIEVLGTFENAAGTMIVAPSQNMTMKLNTDLVPGTKKTITTDLHDLNLRSSGSNQDGYDNITQIIEFSGTDTNFTKKASTGTEGVTIVNEELLNGNHSSAINTNYGSGTRFAALKLANNSDTISFRVDGNSQAYGHENNSQKWGQSYGAPAMDYVGSRMFWKDNPYIYCYDPSTSSSTFAVANNFSQTQSTYATGAVCYDDDGDVYYFFRYTNNLYVRNLTESGNLAAGESGTGYNASVKKAISLGSTTNVANPRLMVAYNDDEDRFYVFHGGNRWQDYQYGLQTFTKSAYNSAANQGTISSTNVKNPSSGQNSANTFHSLFTSEHQAALSAGAQAEYIWSMEHLGGGYVAFPTGDTEAYIYKCQSNALSFQFKITGLDTKNSSTNNNRGIVPKGGASRTGDISINNAALTAADYEIEARVNIQGVEIT